MKSVSIETAQKNLPELLREVEAGEELQLTRKKRVVAKIIPMPRINKKKPDWAETFKKVNAIFGGKPAPGKPGSRIVIDGRR